MAKELDEYTLDILLHYICKICPEIKYEDLKQEHSLTTLGTIVSIFVLISLIENFYKMSVPGNRD